jgi:alkanesulfonate monooxygenase SsuD/methylene tetrahydromethanopterin reductase-like flavin-dependent oxidoreductase (luciferase family)
VIQHDPIVTAKEVASLDLPSNGRSLRRGRRLERRGDEDHGTAFPTRFRVMRERVLAMKEIWTKDEAEFHGEFVRFDRIWSYPKPVQRPPVLLGARDRTPDAVEFCDGWFPRRAGVDAILKQIEDLRALAAQAGRDPKSISISVFGGKTDPSILDRYRGPGSTASCSRCPPRVGRRSCPSDQHAALPR